jgi:hypothetical protein
MKENILFFIVGFITTYLTYKYSLPFKLKKELVLIMSHQFNYQSEEIKSQTNHLFKKYLEDINNPPKINETDKKKKRTRVQSAERRKKSSDVMKKYHADKRLAKERAARKQLSEKTDDVRYSHSQLPLLRPGELIIQ